MEENDEMHFEEFVLHHTNEGIVTSVSDSDPDTEIFYDDGYSSDDTDDTYDSLLEEECERIGIEENEFMNSDKQHGKRYIGHALLLNSKYILDTAISSKSFLRYPMRVVVSYLEGNSIFPTGRWRNGNNETKIQIMQVSINPKTQEYNVVLKTFWLRIVQRTWKRIFRERQDILRKRCSMMNLRHFELRGQHSLNLRSLPGIYGMIKI
jgi:hypothetical protein